MEETTFIQDQGILGMMTGSGVVVQSVLIILIVLSVFSWAITIAKILQFRRARKESEKFHSIFWEARNFARIDESARKLAASPLTHLFASGYRELTHSLTQGGKSDSERDWGLESVERAMRRSEFEQTVQLEKGITFLATVASAAPFIGLFGTVWGIMNAFHGLSTATSTTLQAVAPGISEALVATAIGLAAAIPAAMAYNFFTVTVRHFKQSMSAFTAEFLNVAHKSMNN